MSTGLFSDEESGYNNLENNIEETKYVLKGSAPSTDSSVDVTDDFSEPMEDPDMGGDLDGLEDFEEPTDDKPFDDEPFDAGVEADEDTDPVKYIQQLSGKLGQSLRQYSEDEGQPDFDLEKFAVNSVLSATHTGEMDKEDQRDIINKVKSSGEGDGDDIDVEKDIDVDVDVEKELDSDEMDFDEEPVEEIVEELPLNQGDDVITPEICNDFELGVGDFNRLKHLVKDEGLKESRKKRTLRNKKKVMENVEEPLVEPTVKPETKPSRIKEVDRPFAPKPRIGVQPDPKATK